MRNLHYSLLAFPLILFLASCGSDDNNRAGAGERCGGNLAIACATSLYCQYAEGNCGDNGSFGICSAIPQACTLDYRPVCGCDGQTYGNPCAAAGAGVSILQQDVCPAEVG